MQMNIKFSMAILLSMIFLPAFHIYAQEKKSFKKEINLILDGEDVNYKIKSFPTYFSNIKTLKVYQNEEKKTVRAENSQELKFVDLVSKDTMVLLNKRIGAKKLLMKQVALGTVLILEKSQYSFLTKLTVVTGFALALGAILDSKYGLVIVIPVSIVLADQLI